MKNRFKNGAASLAVLTFLLTSVNNADASSLALTAAGIADGFSLSTFATVNPGGTSYGTFGIAVASNGNIITSNYPNSTRYVFADVDGQTVASALNSVSSDSSTSAYATAGGKAYGAAGGSFVQFNDDGTVNHVLTGVSASPYLGMWGNPVNGHIISTSSAGLIDINTSGSGSFRVINSAFGDGVSVSPDGKTAYLEQNNQIVGFDIATGQQVYSSGSIFSSPDGAGVISSNNNLNGKIIVNDNFGIVWLLNPSTNTAVQIATGGTRGDYVSPDTNNGTVLLDFSDTIERLSCGVNCNIGGGPQAPEPASVGLMFGGFGALALLYLRRTRKPASR